jgi:hypothetical protein
MRTTWQPFTSLLALTFLFSIFILTSCASFPDTKIAFFKNGEEVGCSKNDCKVNQDQLYCKVFAETGTPPPRYTSSPSDTSSKVTSHSGTITDQFGGSTYSYRGTSRKQTDFMQKGLQDMSNALGNLARMKQYEERVENRFNECMSIMMGYDLVRVPFSDPPPTRHEAHTLAEQTCQKHGRHAILRPDNQVDGGLHYECIEGVDP